jgi:hypothetical protein
MEDAELKEAPRDIRRGRHGGGMRRRLTVYQLRLDFGSGPEGLRPNGANRLQAHIAVGLPPSGATPLLHPQ